MHPWGTIGGGVPLTLLHGCSVQLGERLRLPIRLILVSFNIHFKTIQAKLVINDFFHFLQMLKLLARSLEISLHCTLRSS